MLAYPFLTNFHPDFETEELKEGLFNVQSPKRSRVEIPAVCSAGHVQHVAVEPMDRARTALPPR